MCHLDRTFKNNIKIDKELRSKKRTKKNQPELNGSSGIFQNKMDLRYEKFIQYFKSNFA